MSAPEPAKRGVVTRLSDVETERLAWLWWSRLLLGKLNIVDGDPGQGKTTMLLDIAARVTTERDMPDGSPGVLGGVVILTAEDGLADTIRPRLENAGADLTRCVAITDIVEGDDSRLPSIPADLDVVEAACRAIEAKLIIVDPLMAYLDERVNSNRDQDVRRALRSLARLAETTGAAVACVRHLNKMAGGNALYRGGGSIGIIGAARSGLVVGPHPEDASRHIVASTKCNLAAPPPSLVYRLEDAGNGMARVVWEGVTAHDASAILGQPVDDEERSALDEAKSFLADALAGGRRPSLDVQKEARQTGIRDMTLRRARRALTVQVQRDGFGPGSVVYWSLPIHGHDTHTCSPRNSEQVWQSMNKYGSAGQRDDCYACGGVAWHVWPDGSRVCTHCHPLPTSYTNGTGRAAGADAATT